MAHEPPDVLNRVKLGAFGLLGRAVPEQVRANRGGRPNRAKTYVKEGF